MNRNEKETAKRHEQEKLQTILNELLKEEENKYCADCEAKGPRWASWNLGVFLCIRCAGIHRNLGVHVSKVKSVNLDTWTVEQVQSVRVVGNSVAKAIYEANLPTNFRRPQTDSSLEAFIRAKYEHKRYVDKEIVPPKADARDLMNEIDNGGGRSSSGGSHKKQPPTLNITPNPIANNDKLSPKLRAATSKTSPSSKRKERKDGRKPSSSSQKSVGSADSAGGGVNKSSSSNANDLVDLSFDNNSSTSNVGGDRVKDSLDDFFGLNDSSHQPIRNHSSPFLPSVGAANNSAAAAFVTSTTSLPTNLSPTADASFGEFSSAPMNQQQQPTTVGDDNVSNEQLLFSVGGGTGAGDKKSKNDILALYSSNSNVPAAGTPVTGAPVAPQFVNPGMTGMMTSGYYPSYPTAAPANYVYPTTAAVASPMYGNPTPQPVLFGGGIPTNAYAAGVYPPNVLPQAFVNQQSMMVQQPVVGYGGVVGNNAMMSAGPMYNGGGQQQQLQQVREQLASLQIQRVQQQQQPQQPRTQISPVGNTLATNLWQ